MKAFLDHLFALAFVAVVLVGLLWLFGCNFDGTWDDLSWDHPTNWNDVALHPYH